jgi:predicted CXXCH cytochrome family protein
MCHSELEAAAALKLESPHFPVESCLNCHDAHGSEQQKLLLAGTSELCANCHDVEDLNTQHGGQLTEATDCASCHLPHGSEHPKMLLAAQQHVPFADGSCSGCHREPFGTRIRLRARGERLCTACHGEFPHPEGGSVHAALTGDRTRAGCLSCHDPHMSGQRSLLVQGGPELCGQCHEQVVAAAQAETGHAAAADDCTSCHLPHTAEHPRLLSDAKQELCAMCHDVEDEDLAASHLGADLGSLECTGCHSPHGAGHPKLLATNLHPPVEDGCDLCHEGAFNELAEDGGAELCLMCHDDIGELASAAPVPHAAMEMDSCTICHNPHASPQRKLVKLPAGGACAECHDDQVAGPEEVAHGVIDLIGCEACHEPHGGEGEKMLRVSGSELCLGCHTLDRVESGPGEQEVTVLGRFTIPQSTANNIASLRLSADGQSNHPVTGHRTLGTPTPEELKRTETTFTGELSCLTCHNPHKGLSSGLFQWQAAGAMEACQHCHPK